MSDLISRQDAIEAVYKALHTPLPCYGNSLLKDSITLAKAIVNEIPSAEPERKKGKWIDEKINSYTSRTYCSECGSSAPFVYESDDYYGNHAHGETAKTKFCPNCGADMRGGE